MFSFTPGSCFYRVSILIFAIVNINIIGDKLAFADPGGGPSCGSRGSSRHYSGPEYSDGSEYFYYSNGGEAEKAKKAKKAQAKIAQDYTTNFLPGYRKQCEDAKKNRYNRSFYQIKDVSNNDNFSFLDVHRKGQNINLEAGEIKFTIFNTQFTKSTDFCPPYTTKLRSGHPQGKEGKEKFETAIFHLISVSSLETGEHLKSCRNKQAETLNEVISDSVYADAIKRLGLTVKVQMIDSTSSNLDKSIVPSEKLLIIPYGLRMSNGVLEINSYLAKSVYGEKANCMFVSAEKIRAKLDAGMSIVNNKSDEVFANTITKLKKSLSNGPNNINDATTSSAISDQKGAKDNKKDSSDVQITRGTASEER